jgi:hypothetical protein
MKLEVVFGDGPASTLITVTGDLDVETAATFGRLVMGIHDMLGSDATYDLSGVRVRDGAARSTLEIVAHEFREFGPSTLFPQLDAGPDGDGATAPGPPPAS